MAFPEEEQPGVDLLMVDSTNAEVPGLDVIADGLEGDQTGNLPVSKREEGPNPWRRLHPSVRACPCCG